MRCSMYDISVDKQRKWIHFQPTYSLKHRKYEHKKIFEAKKKKIKFRVTTRDIMDKRSCKYKGYLMVLWLKYEILYASEHSQLHKLDIVKCYIGNSHF